MQRYMSNLKGEQTQSTLHGFSHGFYMICTTTRPRNGDARLQKSAGQTIAPRFRIFCLVIDWTGPHFSGKIRVAEVKEGGIPRR